MSGELSSASADGTLIVWDLDPPWQLHQSMGKADDTSPIEDRVQAVAFHPDGHQLATGSGQPSRDGQIMLWRVRDGQIVRAFEEPHSDAVFGLAFSADGNYLASAAADKLVKVFHTGDGQLAKAFQGHTEHALDVSWNRTGRTLASAGADKAIKIWNFVTGERIRTIAQFEEHVTSIQYVGFTDQTLVSAADPRVCLFRESGEHLRNFPGPSSFTFCSPATPDGRIIVAGGQDGVLHVWDGEGKTVLTFGPGGGGEEMQRNSGSFGRKHRCTRMDTDGERGGETLPIHVAANSSARRAPMTPLHSNPWMRYFSGGRPQCSRIARIHPVRVQLDGARYFERCLGED